VKAADFEVSTVICLCSPEYAHSTPDCWTYMCYWKAQIEGMLPDRLVESWVDHYHLRKELRAAPGFRVTLTTPRVKFHNFQSRYTALKYTYL